MKNILKLLFFYFVSGSSLFAASFFCGGSVDRPSEMLYKVYNVNYEGKKRNFVGWEYVAKDGFYFINPNFCLLERVMIVGAKADEFDSKGYRFAQGVFENRNGKFCLYLKSILSGGTLSQVKTYGDERMFVTDRNSGKTVYKGFKCSRQELEKFKTNVLKQFLNKRKK